MIESSDFGIARMPLNHGAGQMPVLGFGTPFAFQPGDDSTNRRESSHAPLGHGIRPGPLEDPVISAIAARVGQTPAQVLWEDALDEINRIQTRQRCNDVVKTGRPGFIPRGR